MVRIYLLFFLSGAAGLIYQVVWSRLLNEIFGVTVYAVTTVLATFLAGLALGGLILGRVADRRTNALRFYGWLELGIGLTGLLGTWGIRLLDPIHIWAANRFAPDAAMLVVVRVLLASIVILPPTFLMGGTLPVITRVFVNRIGRLGRDLGFLYALNTCGAVIGTLAAGFVLIRLVGLYPTLWIAVAINLIVGAISLRLAKSFVAAHQSSEVEPTIDPTETLDREQLTIHQPDEIPVREGTVFGLLVVMGLSGFVSLGLEVFWTRMLILIVGTSTYAFVTMLSSFLAGITLGSFIARMIVDRVRNLRWAFGWIQVGIAVSTLATVSAMEHINTHIVLSRFEGLGRNWLILITARFGVSFLVMLVPTTLIGMTFPFAVKIWARQVHTLGQQLGQVYGANTLGNIIGAIVSGFVLLPALGLQKGIAALSALNLINALWGLLPSAAERRRRPWVMLPGVAVVVGLGVCAVSLLLWRPQPLIIENRDDANELLYYREGTVATVMVVKRGEAADQLEMVVDGIVIGSSYGLTNDKQQALAHFPFLLRPDRPPQNVLTIGLGTGILTGEIAKHASVERVDCLEIAPSVIEAARYFDTYSDQALDDPKVHVINDDGVNFLRRSRNDYDAIISDAKSRTAHAGNALFFSSDYYQLCKEHLSSGGLMIQWVPLEVPPEELRIISRTFLRVFPYCYAWLAPPDSFFLVGVDEPLVLDVDHIERVLQDPSTANLRPYGWLAPHVFISLLVADFDSLKEWLSHETTINSLEHPVLEFYSPRAYATGPAVRSRENLESLSALHAARRNPLRNVILRGAETVHRRQISTSHRAVGRLIDGSALILRQSARIVQRGLTMLEDALTLAPEHGRLRYTAANAYFKAGIALHTQGQPATAVRYFRRAVEIRSDFPEAHHALAHELQSDGKLEEAIAHYRQAVELKPSYAVAHFNLADALISLGRLDDAIRHYRHAVELQTEYAEGRYRLAVALATKGRLDDARQQFEHAVRLEPRWSAALNGLAWILATHGDVTDTDATKAIRLAQRAVELTDRRDAVLLDTLAAAYAASGDFKRATTTAQEAIALATSEGSDNLVRDVTNRLELYQRQQVYVQPTQDSDGSDSP